MRAPRPRAPLAFLAGGIVSGTLCWAGGMLLPEASLLLAIYPGLVFGAILYALGRFYALGRRPGEGLTFTIILLAAVAGWRAALDIGYAHGAQVPMLAAGAIGAAVLAAGLAWAWSLRQRAAYYISLIAVTGGICGQAVELLWDSFPGMDDSLEILLLFVIWQAVIAASIALVLPGARATAARLA